MRKVIDCLLSKFGAQNNREVNVLVSGWYSAKFRLYDMDVSLKDINEMAVVRSLEHVIDVNELSFDDLSEIAMLPALAANKCDIRLRILYLPKLMEKMLMDLCSLEYGFWTDKDKVTISDAGEHIVCVKGEGGIEILGMYLNGTVKSTNEKFSICYTKDEVNRIFNDVTDKVLNGVQVQDQRLLEFIVQRSLFYRLIDSDIGFMLSMEAESVVEKVKAMASVGTEQEEAVNINTMVFSSWGERIGVAFKRFDIKDIKGAQNSLPVTGKKHLSVVINNERDADHQKVEDDEEYCQEWGNW